MKTSVPSVFTCISKYGYSRRYVHYTLLHCLHITVELQHCLSSYKLLIHTKKQILSNIREGGTLHRFGKNYIIVWCKETTRGSFLLDSSPDSQYILSFREAAPEYNLPPYVLVSRGIQK